MAKSQTLVCASVPSETDNQVNSNAVDAWTIRKINRSTIESTKKAARLAGMKIGPWVDFHLRKAAEDILEPPKENALTREMNAIADAVEIKSQEVYKERLETIEEEMRLLLKGQQHMLIALGALSHKQNEIN